MGKFSDLIYDAYTDRENIPRFQIWVNLSHRLFATPNDHYHAITAQGLGRLDGFIILLERETSESRKHTRLEKPVMTDRETIESDGTMLYQLASLWVMGLYEMLRSLRQDKVPMPPSIHACWDIVDPLRIILAKHEPKGNSKDKVYPGLATRNPDGAAGWFYLPRKSTTPAFASRREVADLVLRAFDELPSPAGKPITEEWKRLA